MMTEAMVVPALHTAGVQLLIPQVPGFVVESAIGQSWDSLHKARCQVLSARKRCFHLLPCAIQAGCQNVGDSVVFCPLGVKMVLAHSGVLPSVDAA
jgi:hypothetical protein